MNTNEKLEETRKLIKELLGKLDEIEHEFAQPETKQQGKAHLNQLSDDATMFISRAFTSERRGVDGRSVKDMPCHEVSD